MLEIITWSQLRIHAKPCILINTLGYWDGLLEFLDSTVERRLPEARKSRSAAGGPDASEAVRRAVAQFIP